MTGQHGDRVLVLGASLAGADQLRPRAFQLGTGGDHVRSGGNAGIILVLGDLQAALICGNRLLQERNIGVGGAQIDIIAGQGGLRR